MKLTQEQLDRMIADGQARIDRMRAALPADGTIPIPFICYGCGRERFDFCLRTGDGLPLCQECFDGCVNAMVGGPVEQP